jgi:hypothetical protein
VLPFADWVFLAIGHARRRDAEENAPDEVRRELVEFCAVNICGDATSTRR